MTDEPVEKGRKPISNVDVKWPLDDDLPFLYANHFALYETENEVIIVFGNFLPTGFPKRGREEIDQFIQNAEIKPIAKIVVSQGGFKAFMGLLKSRMEELFSEGEEPND